MKICVFLVFLKYPSIVFDSLLPFLQVCDDFWQILVQGVNWLGFEGYWVIFILFYAWAFVIVSFINFPIWRYYYGKTRVGLRVSFFHYFRGIWVKMGG